MSFNFSIEPQKNVSLSPLWQAVEGYLSVSGNVHEITEIKDKEIHYVKTKVQKSYFLTALKVFSYVASLGVFPTIAACIRNFYRRQYTFKWESWKQLESGADTIYEAIKAKIVTKIHHTKLIANEPCPEETRVKLTTNDFLHCNYIGKGLTNKRLMAAQAPYKAHKDFVPYWTAIWEHNANILNLTSTTEQAEPGFEDQVNPCYPKQKNEPVKFGSLTVTLQEEEVIDPATGFTCYTYKLEKTSDDATEPKQKIIKMFNYKKWPDRGIISLRDLDLIVKVANQSLEKLEGTEAQPYLLAHCKGGLGRTGLVDSAIILQEQIANAKTTAGNVEEQAFHIVETLRKQRGSKFVQTNDQYNLLLQYAMFLLENANIKLIEAKVKNGDFYAYTDEALSKETKKQGKNSLSLNVEKVISELTLSSKGLKKNKVGTHPEIFSLLCQYALECIKVQEQECQIQIQALINNNRLTVYTLNTEMNNLLAKLRGIKATEIKATDKQLLALQECARLSLEKHRIAEECGIDELTKENLERFISNVIKVSRPGIDAKAKESLIAELKAYTSDLCSPLEEEIIKMVESSTKINSEKLEETEINSEELEETEINSEELEEKVKNYLLQSSYLETFINNLIKTSRPGINTEARKSLLAELKAYAVELFKPLEEEISKMVEVASSTEINSENLEEKVKNYLLDSSHKDKIRVGSPLFSHIIVHANSVLKKKDEQRKELLGKLIANDLKAFNEPTSLDKLRIDVIIEILKQKMNLVVDELELTEAAKVEEEETTQVKTELQRLFDEFFYKVEFSSAKEKEKAYDEIFNYAIERLTERKDASQ